MCINWKYRWRCHSRVVAMHFNAGLELMIYFNCICKLDSIKQASIVFLLNIFKWHWMLTCNSTKSCTNDGHTSFGASTSAATTSFQLSFQWIDNFKCTQFEMVTVMSSAISAFQLRVMHLKCRTHAHSLASNNVLSTICLCYCRRCIVFVCSAHSNQNRFWRTFLPFGWK